MVGRIGTALIFLAAAISFVTAHTVPSGPSSCKSNEFWYDTKSCCLSHGGPPSPPPPPKGSDCPPTNYYWGKDQGCCVPRHPPQPQQPPPQCKKGWNWYASLHKCLPNPSPPTPPSPPPAHPSGGGHGHQGGGGYNGNNGNNDNNGHNGGYNGNNGNNNGHNGGSNGNNGHQYRKRSSVNKSRASPLCPTGLDACPISGLTTGDYECLDVATELESCGGCTSLGKGQDCTAIPGAWNVGCDQGRCAIYSCSAGFKRSHDEKSCIPM